MCLHRRVNTEMHLLLLALLGAAAAAPSTELDRNTNNLEAQYYLPRETEPLFYDVSLFLNPDNDVSFDGEVSIRIEAKESTQEIVIHAMEMVIKTVEVRRDVPAGSEVAPNIYLNHVQATDDTHFLRIRTSAALELDVTYIVKITYNSKFADNMFGVYVSTYNDPDGSAKRLITSQLQPTFARRAFPCYDEPGLKAIFRTTIYAPAAYQVVKSNMPKRQQNLKADVEGWVKHEFEDTLIMSTYLIAYLVSNFENINNQASNSLYRVPFSILSRPGTQNNAQFALEFGQRNMLALEQYTEFEYAFPKMDKVAAPDFAAGAMENWGLVIYREVALLVTEGVTTTSTRQNVGRIICHENMHMWFGNEVGPWSWTYTWLNEGFANFFENFATDLVMPQWRMMDQYVIAVQNVFQSDAVLSVNPMTHAVYTPSQVLGTFNAVAYQKSGSVIRMMQHALTPEIFRKGLVHYIKSMSRKSARPEDLYRSLQAAVDEAKYSLPWSVATIMNRWATQGGFPVVRCIRDAPSGNSIACRQERYLTDSSLSHNARWHIPVNWAISTNPNFDDTKPENWIPVSPTTAHSVDIPGLNQAEWYIINKQQTGYYRVDYDVANWRALERVLFNSHATIHHLNRAQLVDDSFNLARNGRLSYEYPLDISRYLVREMDYIPWASANAAFGYIDVVLSSTDVYDLWKKYVLELTAPQYQRLGFIRDPSEEFVTAYHRTIILNLNCRYGNENCVNQAETLLQDYREKNALPHPDIQTTVFCSGLRGGSAENFQFLWDEYLKSSDSSVQSILLNALGCTTNADSRKFYMNQVISEGSAVRDQDRHTVLVSVINSSPESMEDALDFIIENFHLIQPRVQGLTGTTNILNALARMLTSQQHSQKIQEFKNRHSSIFTAGELASIAAIEENIAASITWSNDHFSVVESWLKKYYQEGDGEEGEGGEEGEEDGEPDSANAISASFVILISAVVTFYNRQA